MRTTLLLIIAATACTIGCRKTTVIHDQPPVITERERVIERQPTTTVIERQPDVIIERR